MAKKMTAPKGEDAGSEAATNVMSKAAAVRKAMAKLGRKAKPKVIQDFVKSEFGIEMSVNHVSNIKSTLRNKRRAKQGAAKEPKAEEMAATHSTNGSAHAGNGQAVARGRKGTGIDVDDIAAVKKLAQSVGAQNLHMLIDIVAS